MEKEKGLPIVGGGQGRDEGAVENSAWICGTCILAAVALAIIAAIVGTVGGWW